MLELHGIPVTRDDNPNEIVKSVINLLDRGHQFHDQDISISHRLLAPEGKIPPIIVKFTRITRDHIFTLKRQLQTKSTVDLGLPTENRIYLNESLTQRTRELLKEVKAFLREIIISSLFGPSKAKSSSSKMIVLLQLLALSQV